MQNHYQTLNLSDTATQEEVKAAYRKLAMKHHPDRGGDPEKFKEINTAYSIIGDEKQRQSYDQSLKQRTRTSDHGFGDWSSFFDADMSSMFNEFSKRQQQSSTIKTVALDVPIKDILTGKSFDISIKGTQFPISVPKMFPDNESIIMPGMAKKLFGDRFTDLHVVIRWALPRGVNVLGLDVHYTVETSVLTLIFGGPITVELLDGTAVEINISPNTNTNTSIRVVGRGLTGNSGEKGIMMVRMVPTMPKADDAMYQDLKKYLDSKAC